ncbi:MAG: AHH domain-containing protein [Saprospiraceae bacterium]|nr:AHH domain-containing protein [Saprospiraceae bacterium]
MGLLSSKGYMRMNASSITVQNHTYQNIESSLKISMQVEGIQVNFTDQLETLAANNPGSVFIKVRQLTNTNCDSISLFEEIRTTADYSEDVVLVNYSGIYVVFTKFSSKPQSRILPWLAVEALKRIAMAATGGVIEIGISLILEYFIGDHPSFSAAWDATEIDWFEVAASAAEGAFSEAKYASIVLTAIKEVVKWVIATPYDSYLIDPSGGGSGIRGPGWIAEFGIQITKAFGNAVMEEVLLKKVKKVYICSKKHGSELSPTIRQNLGSLAYNVATKLNKSEISSFVKRWAELKKVLPLFSENAKGRITDAKYLTQVMNAVKHQGDKFKILKQKLGRKHHPATTLENNMTIVTGRIKKSNESTHHICPGNPRNKDAQNALALLESYGIDINESVNGVFLPKSIAAKLNPDDIAHPTVHTDIYYANLWKRLKITKDPISCREALINIGQELSLGKFPYQ